METMTYRARIPDHPLPLGVAHVGRRRHAVHDPGIVHEDVHPAEPLHRRRRHPVHDRLFAQVARDGLGGAARLRHLLDDRGRALGVEVRDPAPVTMTLRALGPPDMKYSLRGRWR
ncbi:hypothetical protein AMK31_33630 [Streptomyces sp. TSRI0107]|nr:hypothetical protein AMK31_33630 [Streptomyces sp. TSRI0107]